MQTLSLSIILPVKNVEQEIGGILRSVISQVNGIETEFLIIDMGSKDGTVLECVQFIKDEKLRGFVVQNGDGSVSAALNTGIQKASGDYVTFIFARRLYMDFLKGYLDTAARTDADFVFGSFSEEDVRAAERRSFSKAVQKQDGQAYMKAVINGTLKIDISAVLLRKKFLKEKEFFFHEECHFGYVEEFVYRCFLQAQTIVQSPTVLVRNSVFELKRGKSKPIGKDIFEKVEAMRRVSLILHTSYKQDTELLALFTDQVIPKTIMNCVDVLLREGNGYNAIRGQLRLLEYDKLLASGRKTDKALKRQIRTWNMLPWMYKSKP